MMIGRKVSRELETQHSHCRIGVAPRARYLAHTEAGVSEHVDGPLLVMSPDQTGWLGG